MTPMQLGAGRVSATDPITLSDWPGLSNFNAPSDLTKPPSEQDWDYHFGRSLLLAPFGGSPLSTQAPPATDFGSSTMPGATPQTAHPSSSARCLGGAFDAVQYVRKLADLNVRLYEHARKLPPVTQIPISDTQSLDSQVFAIDETFRMTQSLIGALKGLYPRVGPAPDFVPDHGTLLLIMSCSNRVFDIYEVIFVHMRACIQHKVMPVTADGKAVSLPQLRIGSFAPPTPSAMVVHMLLIILMASELFDQLQDVLGCWRHNRQDPSGPVQSSPGGMGTAMNGSFTSRTRFPEFNEEIGMAMDRRARHIAVDIVTTRQLLLTNSGLGGGIKVPTD